MREEPPLAPGLAAIAADAAVASHHAMAGDRNEDRIRGERTPDRAGNRVTPVGFSAGDSARKAARPCLVDAGGHGIT